MIDPLISAALEQGGWALVVLVLIALGWAVDRDKLVLGREYTRVVRELETMTEKAERLVREQQEKAAEERRHLLDRIDAQARRLDAMAAVIHHTTMKEPPE